MKICAFSDNHEQLDFQVPPCDLLIIAGDFAPWKGDMFRQGAWVNGPFSNWLNEQPFGQCVITPGNHDCVFEKNRYLIVDLPRTTILHEKEIMWNGLKVYGTSFQPYFCDWSFNRPDNEENLGKIYQNIPDDTDILVTHCPPFGFCDVVEGENDHLGSKMLSKRIGQMKENGHVPKYHFFGHIHTGQHGGVEQDGTRYYNVALCDERYRMVNPVTEIELQEK